MSFKSSFDPKRNAKALLTMAAMVAIGVVIAFAVGGSGDDEGDVISTDYSQIAGTYVISSDKSEMTIDEDGTVDISITRLCDMEGEVQGIYKDNLVLISVNDPNGKGMGLEFTTYDRTLIVTDSSWKYLKNGDEFTFDKKE